jgi:hypothetical protein
MLGALSFDQSTGWNTAGIWTELSVTRESRQNSQTPYLYSLATAACLLVEPDPTSLLA